MPDRSDPFRRSQLSTTFLAFAAAVPAALLLWMTSLYLHTYVTEGAVRAAGLVPYMIMGGVLVGVPTTVALLTLVALPVWLVLRRVRISLPLTMTVGALCGVIARGVITDMWGEPEAGFLPMTVVLITGAGTGAVWWYLTERKPSEAAHRER